MFHCHAKKAWTKTIRKSQDFYLYNVFGISKVSFSTFSVINALTVCTYDYIIIDTFCVVFKPKYSKVRLIFVM